MYVVIVPLNRNLAFFLLSALCLLVGVACHALLLLFVAPVVYKSDEGATNTYSRLTLCFVVVRLSFFCSPYYSFVDTFLVFNLTSFLT